MGTEKRIGKPRKVGDEWVVPVFIGNVRDEGDTYYTSDKIDALATFDDMRRRQLIAEDAARCPSVGRMLQLSTGNMPQHAQFKGLRHQPTEFGFIMWPTEYLDGLHQWMVPIVKKANSEGCTLVEFDRDNDLDESLPTYEW
tara:strand:- start:1936 stop:2358 length:423 start_codon:yes stop_codon:yes gene_type:complete